MIWRPSQALIITFIGAAALITIMIAASDLQEQSRVRVAIVMNGNTDSGITSKGSTNNQNVISPEQCTGTIKMKEFLVDNKDQLFAAMKILTSLYKNPEFEDTNFVKPEYGDFELERVEVINGTAKIYLNNYPAIGGYCEDRYFEAQFYYTATQFPGVNDVELYVDGSVIGKGKSKWKYFTDRYAEQ
ncbi:MAG TPA: GerMN domain-containing protein [Candidatus Nanoarchaeia archaeon]|nr:GerMN domain-containing protein [Candidatus Nanoarchaeia archaeon]